MNQPLDRNGYLRKLYPCPTCGKMKREAGSNCRECHVKAGKHITRGVKSQHYINKSGVKRPMYACLNCGKLKKHDGGMCRECSIEHRKKNKKPNAPCKNCGKPSVSRFKNICKSCQVRAWKDSQRTTPKDICSDCGGKKDHQSNIVRCRRCHSMHLRDLHFRAHGELPRDRDIAEASRLSQSIRRCPSCGGKITTKNCVRCTVLGKIGDKGFV